MSFRAHRLALTSAALLASACGGGDGPSSPSTPPPEPTYAVPVVVYYDQNGNGVLDPSEPVRMPGAEVVAGSATATTAKGSGRAVIQATAGTQTVAIRAESLPPYWVPTTGVTVIFGDNASGKSGYTRLLKRLCRARTGAVEPIFTSAS